MPIDSYRFLDFASRQIIEAWVDPWWGDPSYRVIPPGTTERDVRLHHLHIDPRFGQEVLDVVLPMRRLEELAHPPIAQLLARKPWLLPKLYAGEILEDG